jgi:hypothetical protein
MFSRFLHRVLGFALHANRLRAIDCFAGLCAAAEALAVNFQQVGYPAFIFSLPLNRRIQSVIFPFSSVGKLDSPAPGLHSSSFGLSSPAIGLWPPVSGLRILSSRLRSSMVKLLPPIRERAPPVAQLSSPMIGRQPIFFLKALFNDKNLIK